MKLKIIVFSILVAFFFTGCGPSQSEFETLKKECEAVKDENKSLTIEIEKYKAEIDELKFGAQGLLSKGINHFKQEEYEPTLSR